MKKISVIIPCYNAASYIDRCIGSIAAQKTGIENLEIICIDDASTDDTWRHLQAWEGRFPMHIVLIRQQTNRRQGAARNLGLQYASADWITFVDADDWLEPDYFERLYAPVLKYDCDVSFCEWKTDTSTSLTYFTQREKEREDHYFTADTEEKRKKWIGHRILGDSPCGKIIRKSLLMDFRIFFPEDLAYEDMYWAPLLHVYAKSAYKIKESLYHYFVGGSSTVRSRNADYHVDWLTVQLIKWNDYCERGLMEKYPRELEQDVLNDAACFLKTLVLRYDDPPFSLFLLEREWIVQHISSWRENPYLMNCADIFSVLLDALYSPMNKEEFQLFVKEARKYWGQS